MAWLAAINDGVGNMTGIAINKITAGNSNGFAFEIDVFSVGLFSDDDRIAIRCGVDALLNRLERCFRRGPVAGACDGSINMPFRREQQCGKGDSEEDGCMEEADAGAGREAGQSARPQPH